MVSFNLICVIFNFDCSDGFDSDDSFDSYPPFPLLLKQDTPDLVGTHTKALTDSATISFVGLTFLQGLLLKVSHTPSRTGLQ